MSEVQATMFEAVKEEGVRRRVGGYVFRFPYHAASDLRAEAIDLIRFHEPEIGLGLGGGDLSFVFTLVQKFGFGSVVATENDVIAPAREVAYDFQIVGARRNAGGVFAAESFWETPHRAVHSHEEIIIADFTDAWPLGVPAVCAVVGVRGFGHAVKRPTSVWLAQREDGGFVIPTFQRDWQTYY